MSSAEIGDNKWEVQASKPPVTSAGGLLQLMMIGAFAILFGWITVNSVLGAVTPKKEGGSEIEKQFTKDPATAAPKAPAAAAPAAAAPAAAAPAAAAPAEAAPAAAPPAAPAAAPPAQ